VLSSIQYCPQAGARQLAEYQMAPRPNWKGYLKLALVTSPIALYPAITPAERVSFRRVIRRPATVSVINLSMP
jgi:hypothetical protein